MPRFLPSLFVTFTLAACSRPHPEDLRPEPRPVPASVSQDVAALIARLAAEDPGDRAKAASELQRLGADPARQRDVIEALRAGATAEDPEARAAAGDILRRIDRSESLAPWGGEVTMSARGMEELHIAFRQYADGSAEMDAQYGGGDIELFSAFSLAELADQVNLEARRRGFGEDQFVLNPDGRWTIGPMSASTPNPAEHLVREWRLWVGKRNPGPGWDVGARTLDGRAFEAGLRRGDVILAVDGVECVEIGELRKRLASASKLTVGRAEVVELPAAPEMAEALEPEPREDAGYEHGEFTVTSKAGGVERQVTMSVHFFADGRMESMLAIDGGSAQKISGATFDEWLARVTAAAREKGYTEAEFGLDEDGKLKVLGFVAGPRPSDHRVPGWNLWVNPVPKEPGFHPHEASGGWEVIARSRGGRADATGLKVGDLLLGADGKRPGSLAELAEAMRGAKTVQVVRRRGTEVTLK